MVGTGADDDPHDDVGGFKTSSNIKNAGPGDCECSDSDDDEASSGLFGTASSAKNSGVKGLFD